MHFRAVTRLSLSVALGFSAAVCSAQSTSPADLAQGKIIIMNRNAPDPLFAHSVIVLAHYDKSGGALGVMIHYRSNVTIQRALSGLKGAENRTDTLFVGGPVETDSVIALLRSASPPQGADHVAGNLYLLISKDSIEKALTEGRKPSDLHIFLGYAGWGAGQLEHEVNLDAWSIFDYDEKLIFDEHPDTLWDRLIERTQLQKVLFRQPQ